MNNKKKDMIEYIANSALTIEAEEMAMKEYNITRAEITAARAKRTARSMPKTKSVQSLRAYERRAKEGVARYIQKINAKIYREVRANFDDPDAMRMISEELHKVMPSTYRAANKRLNADARILKMIANKEVGANSALIHKNIRMKPETWTEMLSVDINVDNYNLAELREMRSEMEKIANQGALVVKRTEKGAPILQRNRMEYREKSKTAEQIFSDRQDEIAESKVEGDLPYTKSERKYGIEGAESYDAASSIMESIDKQSEEGYWEWRSSVVMDNYIKSAHDTFGIGSPEANEIENLVRQLKPIDFDSFTSTYTRGQIIYVYENGLQDFNGIISDLRSAISQANQ